MRKRTADERRKHKEQIISSIREHEENLNESEITERIKIETEVELEEDYIDFPDPLEYLIGFFATKADQSYKFQTSSFQENSVGISSSSK